MRPAPRPLTALALSAALLLGGAAMAQDDHLLDFNSLVEAGELTHARQALLDAIDQEPGRADLLFELGLLELRLDNPEAAAFNFSSAAHAFGHRFDLVYNQAISLAEAGDFGAASQILQDAVNSARIPPELRAQVLEALGDSQYEAGAYQLAATTFKQLHELTEAPSAEYKNLLARYQIGQRAELVVPLRQLREQVGHHASVLLATVYADTELGEYAERELLDARTRAIEAVDFEAFSDATVALAAYYYQLERYEDAIDLLHDIPHIDTNTQAKHLLGISHLAKGDPARAQQIFEGAQGLADGFQVYALIAAVQAGNYRDAEAHMGDIANRYAGNLRVFATSQFGPRALLAGAQAYATQGRVDDAAALVMLLPMQNLTPEERTQAGDIYYLAGDYPAAISAYEMVVNASAVDAATYIAAARNYADALLAQKRWKDAKSAYEHVISLTSYDTQAFYHYGWALIGVNDQAAAREAFITAASRGYKPAQDVLRTHF